LARELDLAGWVSNTPQGVLLEVEGSPARLETFVERVQRERPRHSSIHGLETSDHPVAGYTGFEIRSSAGGGARTAVVLPDLATCADCLSEVLDPGDRRYRYPFTNCTNCGPRFSIVEALPYDRPNTTMKGFVMCPACRAEYEDPGDRRFHAQPNACPGCGPHLELWDVGGAVLATGDAALCEAAARLGRGAVVAVKGLGGFHLLVDARSEAAVGTLRQRKRREEKPFAVMYPDLATVKASCEVTAREEDLLRSAGAPIVLLRTRPRAGVAAGVAPGNPYLGVMLPYAPLHHLLLAEVEFPLIATSGNLSEEPICTDEREALHRLSGVADAFLVHNRPIARHVDDSVVRVAAGREMVLRRARGYAPLPVGLCEKVPPLLAVGAQLKDAVAVGIGHDVFVSQHIGDLDTPQAFEAFRKVGDDLSQMYDLRPIAVACDLHPDYLSTQFARRSGLPVVAVQHHHAHVLSCMAENRLQGSVLGVSWDGTGYGPDHTAWGGEFLRVTGAGYERAAHLRTFPLPGGDRAVREPRRSALGLLYELLGGEVFGRLDLPPVQAFAPAELAVLRAMLTKGVHSPRTSSAGRLFDAVAAVTGLRQVTRFEGQAAIELEFALDGVATDQAYEVGDVRSTVVDWSALVRAVLEDVDRGTPASVISARFHNALVAIIVAVAQRVGETRVVLTGGCFQNRYLLERAVRRLRWEGFEPYWHRQLPPNDGGIAVGQVLAAAQVLARAHQVRGNELRIDLGS
jgi:hydrogenase maturation protein HypF